jgi:uncharacterized protein (TIGR00297 family)
MCIVNRPTDTMRNTGKMLMTATLFAFPGTSLPELRLLLPRVSMGIVITGLFGIGGYLSRGVSKRGAIAGWLLALLIYVAAGPSAFITLLGVFILTWIATRFGYVRKAGMGLAENRKGRGARQVLANVGAAAGFALAGLFVPTLQIASAAALAEAAADTASSECGEALARRAYLITSLRRVDIGTDGGISLPGTLAGALASFLIAALATTAGWVPHRYVWAIAAAGFLGTIFDSLLGATLERRGQISNNGVNFTSTIAAGIIALLLNFTS